MKIGGWPIWVKLTGLVVAALLALVACAGVTVLSNRHTGVTTGQLEDLNKANSIVLQLDRAASDLKVAGLQSVIGSRSQQPVQSLPGEVATVQDLLAKLHAVGREVDARASIQRITEVFTDYIAVITRFVANAATDPAAARLGWGQISVDNYLTSAVTSNERDSFAQTIAPAEHQVAGSRATQTKLISITAVIAAVILCLLARFTVRSITAPLLRIRTALGAVADGDLTVVTGVTSTDEVGEMAKMLDRAMSTIRGTITAVAEATRSMSTASGDLNTVSADLKGSADAAVLQAQQVSDSAAEMSETAAGMSTSTAEISASIGEISNQALSASAVAIEAVRTVAATSEAVGALDVASQEISEIIRTITSIAEQTNLLALNATIEAARAGSAGAGFAVVASEVKDLARETAHATEDITVKISAIQTTTEAAISSIGQISLVISEINEKQSTIASAVEEQTAVTAQMGTSVSDISTGSARVTQTIQQMTAGTKQTTDAAGATHDAAAQLAELSGGVQALLARFRY